MTHFYLKTHRTAIVATSTTIEAGERGDGGAPFRTTALTFGFESMIGQRF